MELSASLTAFDDRPVGEHVRTFRATGVECSRGELVVGLELALLLERSVVGVVFFELGLATERTNWDGSMV